MTVPPAFVSLDPWIEPPDPRLLALASAELWRRHRALPIRLDAEGLLLAAGADLDAAELDAIRAATGQPIRVVAGAEDEIAYWLDVLLGGRPRGDVMADSLLHLLDQLGLEVSRRGALPDDAGEALSVEQVMAAFGLAEDVAVEVLALRARLPQVQIHRYTLGPHLAGLLPRADADRWQIVPIAARPGLAVLASPQVLSRRTVARVQAAVGLELRVAVCGPSAIAGALQSVYGNPQAPAQPSDDDAFRRLLAGGAVDAERRDALLRITRVTGDSPVTVALRLGAVTAWQVQCARAAALGLEPCRPERVRADRTLAASGAAALWRRWRCLPIERSGGPAIVACDHAPSADHLSLIAVLLDVEDVTPQYASPGDLDTALRDLPPPRARPYTAAEHLAETGLLAQDRLAVAQRRAERAGIGLPAALLATKAVPAETLVEAHAITAGRPWVRLTRYAPEPETVQLVPEAVARSESALALRRSGRVLTVALLNGQESSGLAALADQTGLAIDPVLAVADGPAAIDRWYERGGRAIPERADDLGQFLIQRGFLSQAQVDGVWEAIGRFDRPLDVALTDRGLLSPEQLVLAFCEHLGLDEARLDPAVRQVEWIDALGRPRVEQVWHDPVDPLAARLLPAKLAEQHGVVPMRQTQGAVEVAFANPLDERAVALLEAVLGLPVRRLVASRLAVEATHRRVYVRRSLGERLLAAGAITQDQLDRALRLHTQTGVRVGKSLVSLRFISEEELGAILAEQAGVPFVDLRAAEPDLTVACLLPADTARGRGILPLYDDGLAVIVACTDLPEAVGLDEIARQIGRAVQPVIVAESAFDEALNRVYRDDYLSQAAGYLVSRSPEDSARWVLSAGQQRFLLGLLAVTGLCAALAPVPTVTLLVILSTAFYVTFSFFKFYLAYRAVTHTLEVETTAGEVAALDDHDLPVYTILVPVYREAEVFPILAQAIERLDYPKAKLDVKILLEEDDHETIAVARRSKLPSHFKLVVVPHGQPKGKPKACNYGLIHAQGEYVVIFDAEDIPEPDQLKKALVAFRKGDERLACVQGKLNYFNRDQNLLTRWFTTEYSMWFDLFLPGLDVSGAPIPLGGTSNHFKTARLRELGAWDPHNVTEDADLGIRLYKAGWKTAVIDSTTYEEANSEVYNWIRQRSRWVKGYIQTYLVHMRHPVKLWRAIGGRAFFSFQLVVGGTFFGFLMNPIYWLITVLWFTTRWELIQEIFPTPIFFIGSFGLYVGNFAFTYLNVAGCLRREYYDLVKYALLSPVYWALMSIAAWKGFLQLFYKPSYWEKTNHGLYKAGAAHMPAPSPEGAR
ncbi:MAG: glycosyltransferase [Chloroflexi bacterium]|nr:glycosyltransferase [Chloroflexota bacterium]